MKPIIYADNAATTKLDQVALDAMLPWLTDEYGNASQPYAFSRAPKKALLEARQAIAESINALPEEVFFTSGGTESDNWAIKGIVNRSDEKHTIITSAIEHHAVLRACKSLEASGYQIVYVKPNKKGIITPEALDAVVTNQTKLISIMFSNNEIGTIEPIKELAIIAHKHGALFHTDAVQAVGHTRIDVNELGIDMLSASAHKFNGPKGVGFLYIRKGTLIHPFIDGGSQEYGLRAGTENVAGVVGMAAALKNNCNCLYKNEKQILSAEQCLLSEISRLDFIRNGDDKHIPGNISISFKNADGEMILHRLDLKGICVSTGSACDGSKTKVSHVIKAIEVPKEYAEGTIRISFGKNNTLEDAKTIGKALVEILG